MERRVRRLEGSSRFQRVVTVQGHNEEEWNAEAAKLEAQGLYHPGRDMLVELRLFGNLNDDKEDVAP
ncbi:hypothetical protein [Methylobacterium tarhaniae]|uniref:hypothetical protein n=1 Tax=Methylobacterium tarhaniae TaxID=1187852 RepID=UPI003CFF235D